MYPCENDMASDAPAHWASTGAWAWLSERLTRGAPTRFGCAAVLLTAATLKAYELATDPALGVLYGARWFQVVLVQYEYILAIWLLSGLSAAHCRRIALLTFIGFAGVSAYLGFTARLLVAALGASMSIRGLSSRSIPLWRC